MKRITFFLLIFFTLMPMAAGRAQEMAKTIDTLAIDIWPDYDRSSVLVLLTGTLPADTKLPANVSVPFPDTAQLNAIARIDSKDGIMKDDIFSTPGPGVMMFVTPDRRFRLEYYLPYTVNNNQRSFDFTWSADLSINKLLLRVQQPKSANSISTKPAAGSVLRGEDGFDYHTFPVRTVKAGEAFSLHVDYQMATAQLSVERLPSRDADLKAPELPSASTAGSGINWPIVIIVIGGLIIVVFFVWQLASRRPSSKVYKSPGQGVDEQSRDKFCNHCGRPVDKEDKFCGQCGEEL